MIMIQASVVDVASRTEARFWPHTKDKVKEMMEDLKRCRGKHKQKRGKMKKPSKMTTGRGGFNDV